MATNAAKRFTGKAKFIAAMTARIHGKRNEGKQS